MGMAPILEKMPRPRTPTNLLDPRGAFRKHPERRKHRENEPTDLPDLPAAPEFLTPQQKRAWKDIVEHCPAGVLKQPDAVAVEIALPER